MPKKKKLKVQPKAKLFVGSVCEQTNATCNFCGELKVCARGSVPCKFSYRDVEEDLKWLRGSFLAAPTLHWVRVDTKWKTETDAADICKDCATQIAKQL
jgi:hypothetical protein